MMKAMKDNRGVTLVELIASIAIFGLVAAAAISMLVFVSQTNADISVDTIENMKIVSSFDLIKSQIRESNQIKVTVDSEGDLRELKFENNSLYTWYEDKFVYKSQSSSTDETVMFEGVKNIAVTSIEELQFGTENIVNYITLTFEFKSGAIKQLAVSCRN